MRVLLVEDEERLANTIARGLRNEGMAVDVVFDGHDALAHAAADAGPSPCGASVRLRVAELLDSAFAERIAPEVHRARPRRRQLTRKRPDAGIDGLESIGAAAGSRTGLAWPQRAWGPTTQRSISRS